MSAFVAGNGYIVKSGPGGDSGYKVSGASGGLLVTLSPVIGTVLEEFFQHKRDQRLGRWRSKANPSWVVYPRNRGALRVIDEATATVYALKRDWDPTKTENLALAKVVTEYRESLPKPWRDAKSGEVWVLDGEPYSVVRDSDGVIDAGPRFFRVNADKWYPGHTDRDFTAGRRIWPTEEATK